MPLSWNLPNPLPNNRHPWNLYLNELPNRGTPTEGPKLTRLKYLLWQSSIYVLPLAKERPRCLFTTRHRFSKLPAETCLLQGGPATTTSPLPGRLNRRNGRTPKTTLPSSLVVPIPRAVTLPVPGPPLHLKTPRANLCLRELLPQTWLNSLRLKLPYPLKVNLPWNMLGVTPCVTRVVLTGTAFELYTGLTKLYLFPYLATRTTLVVSILPKGVLIVLR